MLLYLHGVAGGDFMPALGQFLGSSAGARFERGVLVERRDRAAA